MQTNFVVIFGKKIRQRVSHCYKTNTNRRKSKTCKKDKKKRMNGLVGAFYKTLLENVLFS